MKPQSAKAKGRKLCKEVKARLDDTFGFRDGDVEVRSSGANGVDLMLSPHARTLFPYSVEAKNVEKLSIWSALAQAEENTLAGTQPLLIFSRNRSKKYVALDLEHFLELIKPDGGVVREQDGH